jgi:hypothetical protein
MNVDIGTEAFSGLHNFEFLCSADEETGSGHLTVNATSLEVSAFNCVSNL